MSKKSTKGIRQYTTKKYSKGDRKLIKRAMAVLGWSAEQRRQFLAETGVTQDEEGETRDR